jgi:hypothetical protein
MRALHAVGLQSGEDRLHGSRTVAIRRAFAVDDVTVTSEFADRRFSCGAHRD